jgi:hypothetical protein
MRTIRFASGVTLGFLLLTACARLAAAQTYVWTDERGVVHAAADPSEVPASQRAKAVRDALGHSDRVKIAPPEAPADDPEAPVPAAAAPAKTAPKAPKEPERPYRSFEGDDPRETNSGVGLDTNPEGTSRAQKPEPKAKQKEVDPNHLPPPDPGFEWHCATDPEGGPPKCEQFEKRSSRRERRAEARQKAQKELGVDDPTDEFDPDVAKKVQKRAEQEFKETTPEPSMKAKRSGPDDEDESDSSEDD